MDIEADRAMIVTIVLVFASLVAGSTAALSATPPSDTESCLSHSLPDDQKIAACSAAIRSSNQDNRAKVLALVERAGAYGRRGKYGRTIADTTQAIRAAPSAEAYYTRALAYQNMGEDQRAIRDCNAALAIEPNNENALFVRGSARQNLQDYLGAIEDFSNVLQLDPSRAPARFARGTAYYSGGDYRSALDDFSKAIDLGLTDAAIFRMRALAEAELESHQPTPAFKSSR